MRPALLALVFLSACATSEERIHQQQARLDSACQGYGFKPGSDGYRACWMQLDQRDRSRQVTTVCTGVGSGVVCN